MSAEKNSAATAKGRINLFEKFPLLKRVTKLRSFQFLVILPNLLFFYLLFGAALFGHPIGNQNIMIMFVWILWWFALIAILVPFASRIWCTVCPLPFFGDWLQRRELTRVRSGKAYGLKNQFYGRNKPWPKKLRNIWLQNFGFLSLCLFSALLVTRPIFSFVVLGGLLVLATIFALIWRLRAFCNYFCPISGFLSLFAMTSTIELRSADQDVCLKCKPKSCTVGSESGWACPWGVYMGKLDRNNYCGLCMECVKSCPSDNIALFLRPFGSDIHLKGYDEAWKAFIMTVLAMVYSITLLGPYGTVKDWANVTYSGEVVGFLIYAGTVAGMCLLGLPAIHLLFTWLAQLFSGSKEPRLKSVFIGYAYTLVPFGLLAWIAFSFPLMMVNGTYIVQVISDPFGWGWNIFGTASLHWTPFYPESVPYIQTLVLMIGLVIAILKGYAVAQGLYPERKMALRRFLPIIVYILGL